MERSRKKKKGHKPQNKSQVKNEKGDEPKTDNDWVRGLDQLGLAFANMHLAGLAEVYCKMHMQPNDSEALRCFTAPLVTGGRVWNHRVGTLGT